MNTLPAPWFEYPPKDYLIGLLKASPQLRHAVWIRNDKETRMGTAAGVKTLRISCFLCENGVSSLTCYPKPDGTEFWMGACTDDNCPCIVWGIAPPRLVRRRNRAERQVELEMKKQIEDAKAGKGLGIIEPDEKTKRLIDEHPKAD